MINALERMANNFVDEADIRIQGQKSVDYTSRKNEWFPLSVNGLRKYEAVVQHFNIPLLTYTEEGGTQKTIPGFFRDTRKKTYLPFHDALIVLLFFWVQAANPGQTLQLYVGKVFEIHEAHWLGRNRQELLRNFEALRKRYNRLRGYKVKYSRMERLKLPADSEEPYLDIDTMAALYYVANHNAQWFVPLQRSSLNRQETITALIETEKVLKNTAKNGFLRNAPASGAQVLPPTTGINGGITSYGGNSQPGLKYETSSNSQHSSLKEEYRYSTQQIQSPYANDTYYPAGQGLVVPEYSDSAMDIDEDNGNNSSRCAPVSRYNSEQEKVAADFEDIVFEVNCDIDFTAMKQMLFQGDPMDFL